jgi:hypothetical protein
MKDLKCLHCGQVLYDLHAISGRKIDPHWATIDQDFGCDNSPESNIHLWKAGIMVFSL